MYNLQAIYTITSLLNLKCFASSTLPMIDDDDVIVTQHLYVLFQTVYFFLIKKFSNHFLQVFDFQGDILLFVKHIRNH